MHSRLLHSLLLAAALLAQHSSAHAQTLYTFPDQGFTGVYSFIGTATKTLDMTMYELTDTAAEQALAAAAKKGVQVRVILDQNQEKSANQAAYTYLSANGVSVHWANTTYTVTHQKTITVDSKVSLIMTANLSSQYYTTSRDFAITDTDPKDVAEIELVFNDDFKNAAVTPTKADTLIWSPNLASAALQAVIASAQHTLLVENEEMTDSSIVTALSNRAKAGVAVSVIMTNYNNEYAGEFNTLTKAGVKVYTYPYPSTGLYIHAKVMCADSAYADANLYLGSINFSTASETKNRELGQTTQAAGVISSVTATLQSDIKGGALWTGSSVHHAGERQSARSLRPARP